MNPKLILALAACALSAATAPAAVKVAAAGAGATIVDRTVRVGARQVHYLRAGSGATTIVLLHGWPESSYEWRRMIPLLDGRFTVIAPDLPGIGGSGGPDGGASSPATAFEKTALARDVHAFIATLGAGRVLLVGHDIGGQIAYAYARLFPGDVAGIAILDVPLPGVGPWDMIKTLPVAWHFGFNDQEPLAEQLVAGRQALYFRYMVNTHAADPGAVSDADVATYAAAYRSPESLRAGFSFFRAFSADEKFNVSHREPLDVPVLLVGGDHSVGPLEPAFEQGLKALGATRVSTAVIPNSGHWLAEEQPAATANAIAAFAGNQR